MEKTSTSSGGMFSPRRIGHVNFWTEDHHAVAAFYRSVVGIEEAYRRPAVQAIFMSNGNTYHDIAFMDLASPRGAGHRAGMHHFSLELENERALVDGLHRARQAGFEFDVLLSADVARSAYGNDPDGNRFEVYADVKGNWRTERHGEVAGGNVKWNPGETEPLEESFYPVDPQITVLPDAVFHPRRVSHAVIITNDYAAMVAHYTKIVGLQPLVGGAEDSYVVLGGGLGEETLSLFRSDGGRQPGLHHFGMELADETELTESKIRLAARGLKAEFEVDHATRRSLYVRDPNNQLIQFYVNRGADYASWARLPADLTLFVA